MSTTKPRVLIVEDNEQLGALYCKVLSHIGVETLPATSIRVALEWLATSVPDIVLLDMAMKDGTGVTVIDYLKANPQFRQTEIMIATGEAKYRAYAEEQGIEHFFQKPISVRMLIDFTTRLLGNRSVVPKR